MPTRTGMLPFAFEAGMGFERYVDYALDVPMYFVKRGETIIDVAGASFPRSSRRQLAALPGERATMSDWANHLSTIFPEVRLKRYLEMRGADAGRGLSSDALPAFSVGLLYDQQALDGAWEIVKGWGKEDRARLRDEVPRLGLETVVAGRSLRDVGREVLALIRKGLAARGAKNSSGRDETYFLDPLDAVVAAKSQAEELIARFKEPWGDLSNPPLPNASISGRTSHHKTGRRPAVGANDAPQANSQHRRRRFPRCAWQPAQCRPEPSRDYRS